MRPIISLIKYNALCDYFDANMEIWSREDFLREVCGGGRRTWPTKDRMSNLSALDVCKAERHTSAMWIDGSYEMTDA